MNNTGNQNFVNEAKKRYQMSTSLTDDLYRLSLLYGVPFHYMIPSQEMLPQESIQFFYLDPNWIHSLIDGAISIGRHLSIDQEMDNALMDKTMNMIFKHNATIRPSLLNKNFQNDSSYKNLPVKKNLNDDITEITGFILRSELVENFRGLEFKAFSDNKGILTCLRLETLSPNILLGIYRGKIDNLQIIEPPESLHFGYNTENNNCIKYLRNIENGKIDAGSPSITFKINNRIINMKELAQSLEDKMKSKSILKVGQSVDSATLALQMIINPSTFQFNVIVKPPV